ncbi:MAG: DUF6565 domain-containing protein [Bacteroidota bacterium]
MRLLILSSLLFLVACAPQTKDQFIDRYEVMIDDVKERHDSYTEADWESKDEQMQLYLEEYYPRFEEDLTRDEQVKIWSQAVSYELYRHGSDISVFWKENKNAISELIQENAEFVDEEGRQLMEEIMPDLKEAGKTILEEFIKGAEELKEALEEQE